MARLGRVKIQRIMDLTKRKRTMEKRLPVLLKKTRELAVLCDVPTCLVVYPPGEEQPVVWPSQDAAADVVHRYREVGDSQRLKHKLDGAEFMGKLVDKLKAELSTVEREIREKENNLLVVDFFARRPGNLDGLSPQSCASLGWMVEDKLGAVNAHLQKLRGGAIVPPLPSQVDLAPAGMMPPFSPNLPTPVLQDDVQFPLLLDGLATMEELQADFVNAGLFTSPQPSPSFDDDTV